MGFHSYCQHFYKLGLEQLLSMCYFIALAMITQLLRALSTVVDGVEQTDQCRYPPGKCEDPISMSKLRKYAS
jgi:hypothetical protein